MKDGVGYGWDQDIPREIAFANNLGGAIVSNGPISYMDVSRVGLGEITALPEWSRNVIVAGATVLFIAYILNLPTPNFARMLSGKKRRRRRSR